MNSNDQLDLVGSCLVGCTGSDLTYEFNLYMLDSSSNTWILFTNSSYYFTWGSSNSNLTILKNLFDDHSLQTIWKIQLNVIVAYGNQSYTGSTSVQVLVNYPPLLGVCDINPRNGTTSTLFQISCNGWTDVSGTVTLFSFYGIYFNLFRNKLLFFD